MVLTAQWRGPVTDERGGAAVSAVATFDEVPRPDIVIVPGGPGQVGPHDARPAAGLAGRGGPVDEVDGERLHRRADPRRRRAAGRPPGDHLLAGHGGTRPPGRQAQDDRYVFDGKYATSAGVSAGIDMALALAARIAGDDAAMAAQLGIEYDPQPPFNAGSPATAPRRW